MDLLELMATMNTECIRLLMPLRVPQKQEYLQQVQLSEITEFQNLFQVMTTELVMELLKGPRVLYLQTITMTMTRVLSTQMVKALTIPMTPILALLIQATVGLQTPHLQQ
jgi:hypothetical protein